MGSGWMVAGWCRARPSPSPGIPAVATRRRPVEATAPVSGCHPGPRRLAGARSSSIGAHVARRDLIVVGGGTAGLVAAVGAARQGAKVTLVERARTGGECLWTGCVPSKSLLAAAAAAHTARHSDHLGVTSDRVEVDFPAVMAH